MSHHLPSWALAQGQEPPQPSTFRVLLVAALALIVVLLWPATSEPTAEVPSRPHAGPCVELRQLEHAGVRSGPAYRAAWWGCPEIRQARASRGGGRP